MWAEHPRLGAQLFRTLDRNVNQTLEFEEFVFGCALAGRASLDQRLNFLFLLLDRNEDHTIEMAPTLEVMPLPHPVSCGSSQTRPRSLSTPSVPSLSTTARWPRQCLTLRQ